MLREFNKLIKTRSGRIVLLCHPWLIVWEAIRFFSIMLFLTMGMLAVFPEREDEVGLFTFIAMVTTIFLMLLTSIVKGLKEKHQKRVESPFWSHRLDIPSSNWEPGDPPGEGNKR